MCYQLIELYSACKCLYYQHMVDRCASYGKPRHYIEQRVIYVGYACSFHDSTGPLASGATAELATTEKLTENEGKASDSDVCSVPGSISDYGSTDETSVTTAASDIIVELFHDLLQFGHLSHLWPQVVRLGGTKATIILSRFIRRFGNDLAKRATTELEKQSCKFIQRQSLELATRIEEANRLYSTSAESDNEIVVFKGERFLDEGGVQDANAETEGSEFWDYRIIHDFIFEADVGVQLDLSPISYLEQNVREWVLRAQPKAASGLMHRLYNHVQPYINYMTSQSSHSDKTDKSVLLESKCHCGRVIQDRYIELQDGALDNLKARLQGYGASVQTSQDSDGVVSPQVKSSSVPGTSISNWWKSISPSRRIPKQGLPSHSTSSRTSSEGYACPRTPLPGDHIYLLLCLPFMRWATKLRQDEVCRLNSDREFFTFLRSCNDNARQRKAWPWMLRVNAIAFVQFELFQNDLVNIQLQPSLPAKEHLRHYSFESQECDTIPPIGPNLLMHYFEHPDHADVVPVLFKRIPKRKPGKLVACPIMKSSVGWGLQLVEGTNVLTLFYYGCGAFAAALIVAVTWSVAKNDVQGGFAIATYVLAFLLFVGGVGRVATI